MNLFYKNYTARVAIAIVFVGVAQLFSSCSKDKEMEGPAGSKNTDKLEIQVLGITEDLINTANPTSNAGVTQGSRQSGLTAAKTTTFAGFDAVTSVERDVQKQSGVSIGNASAQSAANGLMAATPMLTNVSYRLLLYKTDGTFVSSTVLTSGTNGMIDAMKGTSYNYYAISYNTNEVVPDVNPAAPTLVLPGGRDILYTSGTISIPANAADGNTPLGLVFQHKFARVAVELNTMGMFGDISTAAVSVSGIVPKTGTINLRTGALSNLTNAPQTITYSSFANTAAGFNDAKEVYIYTADPVATTLTVTLNNLVVNVQQPPSTTVTRSFTTLLAATPSVFTFNITPAAGVGYRAYVNLLESPLTVAGVRWARTNLYYADGTTHNRYRFEPTYAHTNRRNTYFSFKGLIPTAYGTNSDPCTQVYPAGVWRQPTEADFRTLVGGILFAGALPTTYGTSGGLGYLEYTAAGTVAPYESNRLRFNFNGEGVTTSILNGVVDISLGNTYGSSAQIWTSSSAIGLPPIVNLSAIYYEGFYSTPLGVPTRTSQVLGNLLNISAIGANVIASNFKNIRCVRN
jgi:hypothetical protein